MLMKVHPIRQSTEDRIPGHMYSIPGLPGTKSLVQQVWAIWVIVRRWVWDSDMPEALVADEMGHDKIFTLVAAAMICKLLTETFVMVLLLSVLWGNTVEEYVNMARNNVPGIIGEDWEWHPLRIQHSGPHHHIEIQTTPPQGHLADTSAPVPILVVSMPGVADTFKTVIKTITYRADITLINMLNVQQANPTHEDLNTSRDQLEHLRNIHLV